MCKRVCACVRDRDSCNYCPVTSTAAVFTVDIAEISRADPPSIGYLGGVKVSNVYNGPTVLQYGAQGRGLSRYEKCNSNDR